MDFKSVGERNGVLHRQACPGADGKVRCVDGIAKQDNVLVTPLFILDLNEINPGGLVGHQRMAVKIVGEQLLAVGDTGGFVCLVKTRVEPGLFGAFDDEGAGVAVKGIGMDLKQAVLILPDDKGEGVEDLVRAKPDITRFADAQTGLENIGVGFADEAVDAVGGDDQIVVSEAREVA